MAREYTPLPPEYTAPGSHPNPGEYTALPPEYGASCRKSTARKRSGLRLLLAGAIAATLVAGTVAAGTEQDEAMQEQLPLAAALLESTTD